MHVSSRSMQNISVFLFCFFFVFCLFFFVFLFFFSSENFQFLEVKFSIHLKNSVGNPRDQITRCTDFVIFLAPHQVGCFRIARF